MTFLKCNLFLTTFLITRNMKNFYFFSAGCLCFFTTIYAAGQVIPGCLEKEKALALLESAEILLNKARLSFPPCNESDCGTKKPLAFIEISEKMISVVRKNFSTCSKPVEKHEKSRHCSQILASGRNESGLYTIWVGENVTTSRPLLVYCDMETDNGGWTVIQRRGKYPVQQNFNLDWENYKNGFGNLEQEFWLGNENIRALCVNGCVIRFDLKDEKGEKGFALYKSFHLSDDNYKLNISGFTGNVGDCMVKHANRNFSTKDRGETKRAKDYKGGWWHGDNGYYANPNGMYKPGATEDIETVGWFTWKRYNNLASVEIKIRPK